MREAHPGTAWYIRCVSFNSTTLNLDPKITSTKHKKAQNGKTKLDRHALHASCKIMLHALHAFQKLVFCSKIA